MESSNAIEKQGTGKLLVLGIQHMFAMFGATVLVPLVTGMNPAVALFCAGVGTWIFHLITGRKVPVFLGSSFAFMGAIVAVASMYAGGAEPGTEAYILNGLPYATGGIIVAGVLYLVLALLVKIFGADTIRSFFPPIVTGPVIVTIGLMLAPVAISSISTPVAIGETTFPLWINWVVALVTIAALVVVSIFVKGFFKLVPILIGIAVGYIASLIAGIIDFTPINNAAWLALPEFFLPKFDLKAILLIAPIAIVTFVEHIGDIVANGAVVGQDFVKDPGLHRTLIGDGLATMFAGAVGGPANTTYSENTGVLAATKNYNPVTLRIAACLAILMSFIGKFSGFLETIPGPVMGGVSVILFGMITSVGLRTLVESQVDFKKSRNMIICGIMLVMALGGAVLPITSEATLSGYALAALIGIILNKVLPEDL
jgi:uracil permease